MRLPILASFLLLGGPIVECFVPGGAQNVKQKFGFPRTWLRHPSVDTSGMESDDNIGTGRDKVLNKGLHAVQEGSKETGYLSSDRRVFLSALTTVSASLALSSSPPPADAAFQFPFPLPTGNTYLRLVSNSNSTAAASIRQPLKASATFPPDLSTESCLLKLLPVKKPSFRKLETDLLAVSRIRENSEKPITPEMFQEGKERIQEALAYLDNQRSNLEPVFNMNDPTALSIAKATRGEYLVETFRGELLNIITEASKENAAGVYAAQKRALRSLSEVGELLVDRFPYDVPTEGKFSYLPRLLGRAKVTFTICRPRRKGLLLSDKDEILGNVTVLADGFAAPITAGNFVDLAARNFYTNLPVKAVRKRLGVDALLTMAEDDTVAYDIVNAVDRFAGEGGVLQKTFNNIMKKIESEEDDDGTETIVTTMPIIGSFNEGFYDPLTAKPRRIPLEIVQFNRLQSTAKLSYDSGFSSSSKPSAPPSDSTLLSVLKPGFDGLPLLTFDIPGLVAMNHPDKNLNGGSSEIFCLTEKDMVQDRTTLLDGNYAPFGYIIEGYDIMKDLQANDVIGATFVNEWGQLNLKKIRGTSFADAMSQAEEE